MRIISGEFKGRAIPAVEGPGYRPALGKVREAVFSMLESRGAHWPELCVLDTFAGSGSLGLEALSRGAAFACFVEKSAKAAARINRTLEDFGLGSSRARVSKRDVLIYLKSKPEREYDLAFVDPPYRKGMAGPALELLASNGWLAPGAFALAEIEAGADIPEITAFEKLADRKYGQTRILLWRMNNE
jgi:16S rRNA (guanine966-N2)-methyltransferase